MREQIADNVSRVRERIATAAARVGRTAAEVVLVAVAKTHPPAAVAAAYEAGVRDIGENRVEEAAEKRAGVQLPGLSWHMVGHLQSRKARDAVDLFDIVQSVDSIKLAHKLDALAAERGKILPVLIEINVSGEASKYGFPVSDRPVLEAAVAEIVSLGHLSVDGLMTVAFVARDAEEVRPVFAGLRALRDDLRRRFPQANWRHLSMGMTDDLEVAIEEGATMVRVGRAIFGPRG